MNLNNIPNIKQQIIRTSKYYDTIEIRILLDDVLSESDHYDEFKENLRSRLQTHISEIRDLSRDLLESVSYTHLDVYKRQV